MLLKPKIILVIERHVFKSWRHYLTKAEEVSLLVFSPVLYQSDIFSCYCLVCIISILFNNRNALDF